MTVVEVIKDMQKLGVELQEVVDVLNSLRKLQRLFETHESWPKIQKEWNKMITALEEVVVDLRS